MEVETIYKESSKMSSGEKPTEVNKREINWHLCIVSPYFYYLFVYGVYYSIFLAKFETLLFHNTLLILFMFGITVGAHRFWAHRTFKAYITTRILLMLMASIHYQHDLIEWVEDHRLHHKYSDTDVDPHNSKLGFWWSEIGWGLFNKNKLYHEKLKEIDCTDLYSDPVLIFQRKHYYLIRLLSIIIPSVIPWYFWSEDLWISMSIQATLLLHSLYVTGFINSICHLWGPRPYDKNIEPRDNKYATYFTLGEGYHNYHHIFPYDYSASEFGWKYNYNPSTALIDFLEWIGLVYDKKKVIPEVIRKRKLKTGEQNVKFNLHPFIDNMIGLLVMFAWVWVPLTIRSILKQNFWF